MRKGLGEFPPLRNRAVRAKLCEYLIRPVIPNAIWVDFDLHLLKPFLVFAEHTSRMQALALYQGYGELGHMVS